MKEDTKKIRGERRPAIKKWNIRNWKLIESKVKLRQHNLTRVTLWTDGEVNQKQEIDRRQLERISTFEARARAVRRVTANKGGNTPGMDGQRARTADKKMERTRILKVVVEQPKKYRAKALKRVWVLKDNTSERRPLGIPTLRDRCVQSLYHRAVDPVVESTSDRRSFGFRKGRSSHGAILYRQRMRNGRSGAKFIRLTEVEKCSDKIEHKLLMEKTPMCHKPVLRQWLKTGVIEHGALSPTKEGRLQGGVISPRLCNVALNGIQEYVEAKVESHARNVLMKPKTWYSKVHLVRHGDDIVVTAAAKESLPVAREAREEFLKIRGLRIKVTNTRERDLKQGFDFLGFHRVRKPSHWKRNKTNTKSAGTKITLVIKATETARKRVKAKIAGRIKTSLTLDLRAIRLNPVLRGWVNYYAVTWTCYQSIHKVNEYLFYGLFRSQRKKLKGKSIRSAIGKVIGQKSIYRKYKWKWGNVIWPGEVVRKQKKIVKLTRNPYLRYEEGAFRANRKLADRGLRASRYNKYKGKCIYCEQSLRNGEPVELHHKVSKKSGGDDKISNLIPRHRMCHQARTYNQKIAKKERRPGDMIPKVPKGK
jgi:RNA-directed DNA polymerase